MLDSLLATRDTALIEQQLILKDPWSVVTHLEKTHPQLCNRQMPTLTARHQEIISLNEQIKQLFPNVSQFCCRIKVPATSRSYKAKDLAAKLRKLSRKNRQSVRSLLRQISETDRASLIKNIIGDLDDNQRYSDLSGSQSEPHLGLVDCVLDHMPNEERHLLIYNAISQLSKGGDWVPEYEAKQRSLYANYDTYKRVYIALEQLPGAVKDSFLTLARRAQSRVGKVEGSVEQFRQELSTWFDQSMDRTSGVYKRNAKGVSLLLGIAIAFFLNVDALYITSRLSDDENLRRVITEAAINLSKDEVMTSPEEQEPEADTVTSTDQDPQVTTTLPIGQESEVPTTPDPRTELQERQKLQELKQKTNEALKDLVLPIGWSPQNLVNQIACTYDYDKDNINNWDAFYRACADIEVEKTSPSILGQLPTAKQSISFWKSENLGADLAIPYVTLEHSPLPRLNTREHWLVRNSRLSQNIMIHHKAKSIRTAIGWLISGLAISMGAPFWFDALNKVVNVRNTGSKPTSSSKTPQNHASES